jgi:hypothetical protein
MGERAVGIVPVILCLHAPIAIVGQREGSVSEGTIGCSKYVYKFRTAANTGYTGLADESFTVRDLSHVVVTLQSAASCEFRP